VCFPPLTALGVHTTKVQGSILVVCVRPSLCSRPLAMKGGTELMSSKLVAQLDVALAVVGDHLTIAIRRLTRYVAIVQRTPIADKQTAVLPPVLKYGISRVELVPKRTRTVVAIFDACLDIDLAEVGDVRGEREAVINSLEDVLRTGAAIYDELAHGEIAITPTVEQAGASYWARLYFDRLLPLVDRRLRAHVRVSALVDIRDQSMSVTAVVAYKIMSATLCLLEGAPGQNALPSLKMDVLSSWDSVRAVLDPEALLKALTNFDLAAVSRKRWKDVEGLLADLTARDAEKGSNAGPLTALFRWIKIQGLCAEMLAAMKMRDITARNSNQIAAIATIPDEEVAAIRRRTSNLDMP
jgi:hypothetical protein